MIYPIPPKQPKGKDFTAYWEGFLNADEINKILNYPEWLNTKDAYVGVGEKQGVIDKHVRRSNVNWLDLNQETAWLWERLSHVVAEVNSQYFQFNLTGCYEPIQLGIYKESDQGHYDWHTDACPMDTNTPRKLSMTLLLSDPSEFEGGKFQVKTSNDDIQTLEMIKGRAWFLPSYMLHRVTPVTKGIRRSLVLWVGGPAFK
jgi:PKHD-type hydroxylase